MPVNNKHNREKLARHLIAKLSDEDIDWAAEQYLIAVWDGKTSANRLVEGSGDQAFERDVIHYKPETNKWTEDQDRHRLPQYRCHQCKSEDVQGTFTRNVNWPHGDEREAGFPDGYYCHACEKRAGDGTIKYLDTYRAETNQWENP